MQKVNWGIIGLGSIAHQFASGFNHVVNAKLLAIASRNNYKINKFKNNFEITQNFCFSDYESLLENNDIDIVYIALPTFLHYEWIVKSLNASKNVLVEKPATINSYEIEKIKKKYYKEKFIFTEAFMYLYHPQIKKLFELIKSGEIGELIFMESFFGKDILNKKSIFGFKKKKKINPKNRIFNKDMGGGAILDLGCYPVSLSTFVASINKKVSFEKIEIFNKNIDIGPTDVDIDSYVNFKFENGFISRIGASFCKNLGHKTQIFGKKGKLIIEDTWTANPPKIILKKENKEEIIFDFDFRENIYSYEIESLSDLILNGKKKDFFGLTIDDTLQNMKIIDNWKS